MLPRAYISVLEKIREDVLEIKMILYETTRKKTYWGSQEKVEKIILRQAANLRWELQKSAHR